MRLNCFVSLTAIAAALSLPSLASAQTVHTITPHFPDHFKVRTTSVNDQDTVTQGQHQTTHTEMEALADTQKQGSGYHAVYTLVSMKADSTGPDGKPTAQGQKAMEIAQMFSTIGAAQVTLDNNLDPVSVDNIEEIKAKLKQAMTSSPEGQKDGTGEKVYDMMFGNLTPQSAAAFLKMAKQQGTVFNKPLPMGQAVPLSSTPMQFMGANLNLNATIALKDWQEGKTAHLTMVMAPSDADMREFMSGLFKGIVSRMVPPDGSERSKAQVSQMMDRMVDNMKMHIQTTCEIDLDLSNYINTHTVCSGTTDMTIDLRKIMPEEMLKEKPEMAAKLPVITMTQTSHSVTDAVLVN